MLSTSTSSKKKNMRTPGIEPGAQLWQSWILPLNQVRLFTFPYFSCTRLNLVVVSSQLGRRADMSECH